LYDLFGCADGINSEGLTVAMLADDESAARYPAPPITTPGVGFHTQQITRFLLDSCSTVEEAQEALYLNKHYAFLLPAHFIIADRHGSSFVWEWSHLQHSEHVIDGGGEIQVLTNHPLHEPEPADVPVESDPGWTHRRLARLRDAVTSAGDNVTPRELQDTHAGVRLTRAFAREMTGNPDADTVARTIWHSIYDIDARRIDVSFFLGDNADGADRRSPYESFDLGG
jgi:hypothetical protein